jgi:hypothetical protein
VFFIQAADKSNRLVARPESPIHRKLANLGARPDPKSQPAVPMQEVIAKTNQGESPGSGNSGGKGMAGPRNQRTGMPGLALGGKLDRMTGAASLGSDERLVCGSP